MTANELAAFLNITIPQAQEFIDRTDRFDRAQESLHDLEAAQRLASGEDDPQETAAWDFNWSFDATND